jgi:hypothetical protein
LEPAQAEAFLGSAQAEASLSVGARGMQGRMTGCPDSAESSVLLRFLAFCHESFMAAATPINARAGFVNYR